MEVLAFVFQAVTQADGSIYFHMLTEPARMVAEECLKIANEINNTPEIPQVIMCMPPILDVPVL